MRVGVFTLNLDLIFHLFTKVDDLVGFSSQSWLSPLLFGRLEESCPLFFVVCHCLLRKLFFCFIGKKE